MEVEAGMRLAKLSLVGFKSFADRTEIRFDAPVVGIVGPNGCGKSNIVDAIKWVLGEQSAKSLRGGAMMDVIFNGAATRKPSGMASVTLTFENLKNDEGKRHLPIDLDEVAVTRQLFRDGVSEYLINGHRARLRDVRELFMDTGVGVDAYSVIEQGRVDAMLQSNAQERREIFEEAAGISRFKARKKEAVRKLERAEANLALVRQRLDDNERRLRSVKIQATRARNFQEYNVRLRELQLTHSLAAYHKLHEQLEELVEQLEQAEADRAVAARELAEREQALADFDIERQAVLKSQRSLEHDRSQAQSRRDQAQQKRQFAQSAQRDVEQQMQRDAARLDDLNKRFAQLETEEKQQGELAVKLDAQRQDMQKRLDAAQQEHRELQHKINAMRSEVDDQRNGVTQLLQKSSRLSNELHSLEAYRENLTSTRQRLSTRAVRR